MTTPHVIASSSGHHSQSATSNGIVGNHFRVGKKIGEGSFGVVFEGEYLTPKFLLFQNFLGSRVAWTIPTESFDLISARLTTTQCHAEGCISVHGSPVGDHRVMVT